MPHRGCFGTSRRDLACVAVGQQTRLTPSLLSRSASSCVYFVQYGPNSQISTLLLGRVTYEMMEAAWRMATRTVAMPDWTEPFARTIDAAKKYVVSSTRGTLEACRLGGS